MYRFETKIDISINTQANAYTRKRMLTFTKVFLNHGVLEWALSQIFQEPKAQPSAEQSYPAITINCR